MPTTTWPSSRAAAASSIPLEAAMSDRGGVTVIGAGIVGICCASYLQRAGFRVTIVDERPPGEGCSFGNAGIISPRSCVPVAEPGQLWKVASYLRDPLGPLAVRPSYFP